MIMKTLTHKTHENLVDYMAGTMAIIKNILGNKNIKLDSETKELMQIVADCYCSIQFDGFECINKRYVNQFNQYSSKLLVDLVTKGILK